MKQNNDHLTQLQELRQGKELDPGELKTLFKLYNSSEGNVQVSDLLDKEWAEYTEDQPFDIDSPKLLAKIKRSLGLQLSPQTKINKLLPWFSGAAAAIVISILVSAGSFYDIRLKNANVVYLQEITAPEH
ncbi:hypothetical protein [Gaoshiqia sp. Z1-71]|uniref:hypothetical protein n=1 Tax=Gaoshiqia hydrogeniformans TaxID=3290090 RepID=UPI003BF84C1C